MATSGNVTLEERALYGWDHVLVLGNPALRLHITRDVGPRVIHCGPSDDVNLFHVKEDHLGKTGGEKWRLYGGHRLWHAPEDKVRTYVPDNSPVPHTWDGVRLTLSSPTEEITGLRKTMRIEMHPTRPQVTVVHTITNDGLEPVPTAAWCLTVLQGGGHALLPNEPFGPFPEHLLPARPMVLWPYTRLNDPRFKFHDSHFEVHHSDEDGQPLKVGIRNSVNWGAYSNQGYCFVKCTPLQEDGTYPDFNSNWEVYTDSGMLELETLSPLVNLDPGNKVEHSETWVVLSVEPDSDLLAIIQKTAAEISC